MNNYYRAMSLRRDVNPLTLQARMRDLGTTHPQLVEDAAVILDNPRYKAEYDKLHSQYEALACAYDRLAERMHTNTGNWSDRLAEF